MKAPEPQPQRSGPSPAQAPAFTAEEAPSFDKRLTPVIAAQWPEPQATSTETARPSPVPIPDEARRSRLEIDPQDLPSPSAAQATPSPSATAYSSTPAIAVTTSTPSISLAPSEGEEHAFWNTTPQYSVPPASFVTDPPPPKPTRARATLLKVVFVAFVAIAMGLIYFEASIAYHVPWQEPQLLVNRIRQR